MFRKLVIGVVLSAFTGAATAAEREPIGSVRKVMGEARIVSSGQSVPARVGSKLYQGDVLQTGAGASLGAVLRDDTIISMGPDSELVFDEFVFEPAEGRLSLLVRFLRGTAAFISGQISKLSPGASKVETPVATIGVRGTRLLVKIAAP